MDRFGVKTASNVKGFTKVTLAMLGPPTIDFVKPRGPSVFDIDDTDLAADEIQIGLFDNTFERLSATAPVRFLNDVADADNFVGGDSRRFYLRVVDGAAKGRKFLEADVEWWTSFANNSNRAPGEVFDDPPSKLSLFEVPGKPGVFVSRGLMIVCDAEDRALAPDSGIPSGHPLFASHGGQRNEQQSNFRIRRGGMFSFAVAKYTRKGSSSAVTSAPVPVFKTSSRRLLPLQVYIVRTTAGGARSIEPNDVFANDLKEITETYERIGLWCWTFVSDTDAAKPGVTVVKATTQLEYSLAVVDPPFGIRVAPIDNSGLKTLADAFPGQANTLRLFFVASVGRDAGLTFNPGLAALSDPNFPPPTAKEIGASFVNSSHSPYVAAHELGHSLTDKARVVRDPSTGDAIVVSHFQEDLAMHPRLLADANLMTGRGLLAKRGFGRPKRLWSLDPGGLTNQLLNVVGSRFTR